MSKLWIIGAGLAGSEAAWQCARRGVEVELFEMRPGRSTPAHQTGNFAELVCSNSLKSDSEHTAPWLLKEEMRRAGSLLLEIARRYAVPAGHALAVDREAFAAKVTEAILREPRIRVRREEVTRIDEEAISVIATGPLTSEGLSDEIARLSSTAGAGAAAADESETARRRCSAQGQGRSIREGESGPPGAPGREQGADGSRGAGASPRRARNGDAVSAPPEGSPRAGGAEMHRLYFYDSISPIVEADSIDMSKVYLAARYDKGTADYINCPMSQEEYGRFYEALVTAESLEARDWEKLNYFEGCLPIEEIARRGRETLRFGPMKPVGLRDPRTGRPPYAVVQLRQENLRADSYNLVGFQNHLKFGEQARVLRLIPGLENARFLRYGQIHRNTYVNAPLLLRDTLQMQAHPRVFLAGQICGVEGYVESIATGLMAGLHAADLAAGTEVVAPPRASALGSLVHYITHADAKNFQPANITFDLLPPLEKKIRDRAERHRRQCELALREFDRWLEESSRRSSRDGASSSVEQAGIGVRAARSPRTGL
jgi:methylenetetrahydrofolate--tRNA-(uracil-5-)-methyltransferase